MKGSETGTRGAVAPALAISAALAGPVAAGDGLTRRVDAVIDAWVAEGRIVGVTAVIARGGDVVYRRAAGFADREAGAPMAEGSIVRLASMTKTIVSAATLALVEQGKLSLADRATEWLPWFAPATEDGRRQDITIRQLMTHTAGLGYSFVRAHGPDYTAAGVDEGIGGRAVTLEENLRRLAALPLLFEPGTEWCYSPATDVLGAVVERASGMALPDAVEHYVTRPLGMADTTFLVRDVARLATAYRDGEDGPVRMEGADAYVPFERPMPVSTSIATDPDAFPSGGGGMSGTADEYLRFLEALRTGGGPILSPASAAALRTHAIGDLRAWTEGEGWGFGLGAAVLLDPEAAGTPQSAGTWQWGGALGSHWFVDPAEELTVVVLTNTAIAGVIGAFPEELRDAIYSGLWTGMR